ncbi:hypothetical protein ABPG74_022670 [Tetrahymena malaccensis]
MGNLLTSSSSNKQIDPDCKELDFIFDKKFNDRLLNEYCKQIGQLQKLNVLKLEFGSVNKNVNEQKLIQFLEGTNTCSSLEQIEIYFEYQKLNEKIVAGLNQGLKKCQNINCLKFFFFDSYRKNDKQKPCGDSQIKLISQILSVNSVKTQFIKLDLSQISNSGLIILSNSLNQCSNINTFIINLKESQMIFADGIQCLSQSISNHINLKILQLEFFDCNLTDQTAQYLFQGITKCQKLCKLNITLQATYQLTDEAIKCLSEAFIQLSNLQILIINIMMNNFGEQGIGQILGKSVLQCKNLKNIYFTLALNKILQNDAEILCKELSKSHTLNFITIFFFFLDIQDRPNQNKRLEQICKKTKKLISLKLLV